MTDSTLNNPNKNIQEPREGEDKTLLLYQRGQTVEGIVLSIPGNNKATVLKVGNYYASLNKDRITWDSDDPNPEDYLYVGQKLNVKILRVNHNKKTMVVGLRDLLEKSTISLNVIPGTITEGVVIRKVNSGFIISIKESEAKSSSGKSFTEDIKGGLYAIAGYIINLLLLAGIFGLGSLIFG